jgi:hypothetical protein
MTVKAIFDECSVPFWIDVVDRLSKDYSWEPCYWTGDPDFGKRVKNKFPKVVFHPNIDAIRGIPAEECKNISFPLLDQPILEEFAFCESISLSMMNRMDRNNTLSFIERERLFKDYLRYWAGMLEYFSPDIVVFSVSPHLIYDYVLYCLCKQKKIQTVLFEQTSLDGWIYPEAQFEVGSTILKNRYQELLHAWKQGKLKKISLSEEAESYLKRVSGDYSTAIPFYMKDQYAQNNLIRYFGKSLFSNPKEVTKTIKKGWYLFSRSHYIKQRGKSIQNSNMKGFEYLFCKIDGMRKKNALKRYYNTLEKSAEFDHAYIYFPLHYQPENTSNPLGEVFDDQFLIIDMLSKYAPDGWKIYIKEHPSQWHPKLHGECYRSPDFYDRLVEMPNVQLVPISTPNFELIDHARAVVTITGTAGWEAVVRGKPALIFGHAWYKFCEGVFYVPSVEKCKEALMKIKKGYTVDHELVRLFLSGIQEIGTNAYVEPSFAKIVNFSPEENILHLTSMLQKFYTNNVKG